MKGSLIVGSLFLAVLFIMPIVLANDVAYVYRNERAIEPGFVSVIEEENYSIEMIQDEDIPYTDFSNYDLILVGNEILRNVRHIPANEVPVIIANPRYVDDFGLMGRGMTSRLSANRPLTFKKDNFMGQVYEFPEDKSVKTLQVHYIPDRYIGEGVRSIITTNMGYSRPLGDVVEYIDADEETTRKCFFGATETKYWAPDGRYAFWECLDFVTKRHDVMIDNGYSNSVNGIRIKDVEMNEYVDESTDLVCNKSYRIDFRTVNVGNYVEDVIINAGFGDVVWDTEREDLEPGESTTAGSKTLIVEFAEGNYMVYAEANIEGDAHVYDNVRVRLVNVVCSGEDEDDGSNDGNGTGGGDSEDGDTGGDGSDEGDGNETSEMQWVCPSDGMIRDDCVSFSGGTKSRCYLDEEKSSWDHCSAGWEEVGEDSDEGSIEQWMCEVENSVRDDCLSFSSPNSNGLITRCYYNEEGNYDMCSSGWMSSEGS